MHKRLRGEGKGERGPCLHLSKFLSGMNGLTLLLMLELSGGERSRTGPEAVGCIER